MHYRGQEKYLPCSTTHSSSEAREWISRTKNGARWHVLVNIPSRTRYGRLHMRLESSPLRKFEIKEVSLVYKVKMGK